MSKKVILKPSKEELNQLYWDQKLPINTIAVKFGVGYETVSRWVRLYSIPRKGPLGFHTLYSFTKQDFERLYNEKHLNMDEVAKELGCSRNTVYRWMNMFGIERRGVGKKKFINWEKEKLVDLYLNQGLSSRDIAKLYGVYKGQVTYQLRKFHIPLKDPNGEGQRIQKTRVKDNYGYIRVYAPNHPRAGAKGFVREHILVWEEAHKTSLPMGWEVHHWNGVQDDNRPENLVAMPSRKHRQILPMFQNRISCLEAENTKLRKSLKDNQSLFLVGV